ncbi:GNAT family N-acetyltransferase [Allosphingosinicella flava]|uniref:GNAT family N-acetyltransferase n=1 Tax=Allosphingosinicella flava TaxID=2771430 RepID=A0A7T2LLG8_9SPHN|nr:GNAT family N-acetyltransferase [Sphingosinicella flava]QPQ54505.1 GNAT family N-acetyltransferase [Sphingosinicella flava]
MLRTVRQEDLQAFFEHQCDPVATELAAFPSRGREAFDAHWAKILDDPGFWVRTIEVEDGVAGYVCAFPREGRWEIAYWLDRALWDRGIAARAVAEFLTLFPERPVFATVAEHNRPSLRVLEKSGFRFVERYESEGDVAELLMTLERAD